MRRSFHPRWSLCWALSLLLAFPQVTLISIGQAHAAAKAKADAAQIARGVHQWTGYVAKQAAATIKPELVKDNKRAVPFWEALKRLSAASSQLERYLSRNRCLNQSHSRNLSPSSNPCLWTTEVGSTEGLRRWRI